MGRRRKSKVAKVPLNNSKDADASPTPIGMDKLALNKQFAQRYEASKRKQLLASAPAALLDGGDESQEWSSSSEEEDEFGELLTKGIDRRVRETLEAIRRKDPKIYDKSSHFFRNRGNNEESSEEEKSIKDDGAASEDEPVAGWDAIESAANAEMKKLTVKDYVRQRLLKDGRLSDSEDDADELEGNSDDDGEHGEKRQNSLDVSKNDGDLQMNGGEGVNDSTANGERTNGLGKHVDDNTGSVVNDGDLEDEDSGDDFFSKKKKTAEEIEEEEKDFQIFLQKKGKKSSGKAGEELLLHSYLENEKPDEKERFLRDFVLNNGWLDRNAGDAPRANEYEIEVDTEDPDKTDSDDEKKAEEDEKFEEKVDTFEAKYNFRFEDPEGTQIVSHGREIPNSMRRPDERRKRAREARRLRKQREKIDKIEEIKRLKSLKRKEIQARLIAIEEAAGEGLDLSGMDLDGDFDPEEFNRQMEAKFGDEYYATKDTEMKELADEGAANASERRFEGKRTEKVPEEIREDVNKLVDEYYDLNYEDIVGGTPVRFKYKKVEAEAFNMTAEDILGMEDKDLNSLVSMKYLAPYRSVRDTKKQSWRVREKLNKMKHAKREESAADSMKEPEIEADVDDREGQGMQIKEDNVGNSKKRRKRKKRDVKGEGGKRQDQHKSVENGGSNATEENEGGVAKSGEGQGDSDKGKDTASRRKRKKRKKNRDGAAAGLSEKRKEAYALASF
eukprot:GFKZ01003429.1.p1 GENE.GFKZ01003429.1~~GFKZ01003429.1.p1  ORF type:complete len:728 (+),score=216.51 GFKZ01003429.1:114-2297(+)